ncbi:hypothetical protein CASFOL_007128 [Castilleja foliolosa]|uniref:Uncharacterized protein n=1 Tax=Castilleja foliolosa TaxID=1961234 RepID=A0ABD3EC68_9LAMI
MSIRFKFRSSVNFDTLEIGDRSSITVRELRTKILKGKQQQQGFDLVFSDAVSGLEFKGDDCQISDGSSVIVRRVPAGTLPSAVVSPIQAVKDVGMKQSHNRSPANAPVDEFDDLGADLCPVPDSNFPDFNLELNQNDWMDNEVQVTSLRLEYQQHGPSDPRQVIPRGCDQSGNEKNILPRIDQKIESNKLPTSNFPVEQCTNLPVEMKCPLCSTFFKEAVMIPCCQHSFCQNCIRQVLIEKGRCPKCFSNKCNVGDLLPNLSLRQAIEHFLEAQMLDAGVENAMQKNAPDGESGIQAKEFSCAPSVVQKELEFPQSYYATGKGSNLVHTEAFYDQQVQRKFPFGTTGNRDRKSAFPPQKVNQVDNMSGYPRHNNMQRRPGDHEPSADFQGENQPVIPLANVHNEAESNTKRQGGFWMDSGGGDRNFSGFGGHRKGIRTCYTCGSPDHLMRDCPMSHPNPMFQPGNGAFHGGMPGYAPYWNGSSMPTFRPYANMYSNPVMMPFNASMVPVSPFAAAPYYPSMGGGLPDPGGNTRMGNLGHPRHPEHFGLQHCENKRKHSTEDLEREYISDEEDDSPERYPYNTPEKSHDHKQKEAKPSRTRSDDSYSRRSSGKIQHTKYLHSDVRDVDGRVVKGSRSSYSGRDKRPSHGEKSNSGKEVASRSSEGRHKHHHGESKKHHHDRKRQQYESDSSYGHHSAQKDDKRRVESAVRDSHKGYKERDTGRDHSRKHSREEQRDDRRQVANNSFDEYRKDEYRYNKRRAL